MLEKWDLIEWCATGILMPQCYQNVTYDVEPNPELGIMYHVAVVKKIEPEPVQGIFKGKDQKVKIIDAAIFDAVLLDPVYYIRHAIQYGYSGVVARRGTSKEDGRHTAELIEGVFELLQLSEEELQKCIHEKN